MPHHCTYSTAQVKEPKNSTPNIGVSRTSQKQESNRVNVIFGGHQSQVRQKYVLCEVTQNGNIVPGGNISREVMRNSSE